MSRHATAATTALIGDGRVPPERAAIERRVARIASLIDSRRLEGEWDPERLLLVPRPDGHLTRDLACAVAGCRNVRRGVDPLCHAHSRRFDRSGHEDLGAWLVSDGPQFRRHWVSEQSCVVTDEAGERCPRPAVGPRRLCHLHDTAWRDQRAAGVGFEQFLAAARPLGSFGPCVASSCYLAAAHKKSRLCEIHDRLWRAEGRPPGRHFEEWAARARQPINGRVLSLRGLPELVRLELLYAIGCRVQEQVRTSPGNVRGYVDRLRESAVVSVLDLDVATIDPTGNRDHGRFARFAVDRVRLAYGDAEVEREGDVWDLRLFGRSGHLDFTAIRQGWLREATKAWAATAVGSRSHQMLQRRVQAVGVLSGLLASGPGGGQDPTALGRGDVDRFLLRMRSATSATTGRPYSHRRATGIVEDCAFVLREARELGLLGALAPTFAIRRGEGGRNVVDEKPGRALPPQVVAQLDAQLEVLRAVPGSTGGPSHRGLGMLGDHAGEMAVLAYSLLKGTGRRVGEVASLHLECLDVDEHAKTVLVYDNHKALRMRRRLPLADSALAEAIRAQQRWVAERFPDTPREELWLLPRANKNATGTAHVPAHQITMWTREWANRIPRIDTGTLDASGEAVPFDRRGIHPQAFRHTYAQTLADEGVAPSVLRDLMDHRSINTTLGYYQVGEARKRQAMELLARHTIDNRGTARPVDGERSRAAELREQLSWVAVPMGKCAEPTNVRAGGGACPIRYQCAGCPHFESDPSYLPELRAYADDLRREREAMLAAGAADWAVANVARQLEVIVGHVRAHEQALGRLVGDERALIDDASATLRKARQSVPVAFGRRRGPGGDG